jgi:hypothetical protein
MLSLAPPTCWRPAFGVAALLYLIFDAVTRGPVSKNFLMIFWPAVVSALVAAKGAAWLRWAGLPDAPMPKSIVMRISAVVFFAGGAVLCGTILTLPASAPDVLRWQLFLPAAGAALIGGCWSALALWRGKVARAFARGVAATALCWELIFLACLLPRIRS